MVNRTNKINVEFRVAGFVASWQLSRSIEELLVHCISNMGLTHDDIGQIVIIDKEHYTTTIREFDNKANRTDDDDFIGVAKTIPKRLDSGKISSNIFLLDGLIAQSLKAISKRGDFSILNEIEQQSLYTIYHELGHCKDAKIRQDLETPALTNSTNSFRIRKVCNYYRSILLGEFAASFHSGKFMTKTLFGREYNNIKIMIENKLTYISKLKQKYLKDHSKLYELAFLVSGFFWTILIQYSKLIGVKLNNNELRNLSVQLWNEVTNETNIIMEDYCSLLFDVAQLYPCWDSDYCCNIDEIWNLLALSFDYKFVQNEHGDALFWN